MLLVQRCYTPLEDQPALRLSLGSHSVMTRLIKAQVINNRMQRSVLCVTYTHVKHISGRVLARRRKLIAHDEREECNIGDIVVLRKVPKLSKRKHHEVVEFVRRANHVKQVDPAFTQAPALFQFMPASARRGAGAPIPAAAAAVLAGDAAASKGESAL